VNLEPVAAPDPASGNSAEGGYEDRNRDDRGSQEGRRRPHRFTENGTRPQLQQFALIDPATGFGAFGRLRAIRLRP
jgi:hypothetical protein